MATFVHFDPIRLQSVQSISPAQPLANQTRTSDPEAESDCYQHGLEASTASCSGIPMCLICLTCLPVHFIHSLAQLSLNTTCGGLLTALTNNNPSLCDFILQVARVMTQHRIVIDKHKSGKCRARCFKYQNISEHMCQWTSHNLCMGRSTPWLSNKIWLNA